MLPVIFLRAQSGAKPNNRAVGAGWPKRLCRPTEIIAYRGCTAATNWGDEPKWERRADEAQRDAVIGAPHRTRARVYDRHSVGVRRIEAIMIRVPTVVLPAVEDLGDAQLSQYRRAAAGVISQSPVLTHQSVIRAALEKGRQRASQSLGPEYTGRLHPRS